jgi:hypothetical protein
MANLPVRDIATELWRHDGHEATIATVVGVPAVICEVCEVAMIDPANLDGTERVKVT